MSDNQETQQHGGESQDHANAEESQSKSWPPEVEQLLQRLSSELALEGSPREDGWIDLQVPPERVAEIGKRLRDEFKMNYLSSLSAVDWEDEGFEVVYHLLELGTDRRLALRARVPREQPSLPSVTPIWPTADWHEREAWDLMGVKFEGHPDLRRILMREDWVGHPLRKDYVDQRPQRERQIKP